VSLKLAIDVQDNTLIPQYDLQQNGKEEAAMPNCPECENELDFELDEVEAGDVIACDECGTEFEVVAVEPLELARVEDALDEDDDLFKEDEEEG
jgi:alpha-aminoadipate carrier protein LysW